MAAETFRIEIPIEVDDNTDPGISSATRKMNSFEQSVEKTQQHLNKMNSSRFSTTLDVVDKASSIVDKVQSGIKGVVGKAWSITMSVVDKATAPIQGIINLLKNPIFQFASMAGITLGVGDAINTFKNFESTMSQVSAISGATGKDLDALTAKAKELGANTKFTATEAGEAFNYMAMAGWKTEDMLNGVDGILNLAAASGEDLATTSDIVTDALTAFGLAASDSTHFSDVLAKTAASANTNVSLMGETFKYVGTMAGSLGYSIEDISLAIGLMANSGLKGTQAGTSLNAIMTRLSTNTSGATDAIKKLGVEFFNSDGTARDLGSVMEELREATKGMSQEQKTNLANTVAGMEAQKGLLAILNASDKDYKTLKQSISEADGAAADMSETMLDNLQGSFTLLSSAVDGVKISLGERLAPYVREFADWLTDHMPQVQDAVGKVMDFVDEKVDKLKETIADFTSSDEWADADIWGKIGIAWDKIVAEPFSEWWDSTGQQFFIDKAASLGETLGSGISHGLLFLLGLDAEGPVDDGKTIGTSFIDGFIKGFDGKKVKKALSDAVSGFVEEHPWITALGAGYGALSVGGKALKGASKVGDGVRNIKELFGKNGNGSGAGDILGKTVSTMTVNAAVVNINGGTGSNVAQAAKNIFSGGGSAGAGALLTGGGGTPLLTGPTAATGGAATAGGLTSAGSWLSKILTLGSTGSVEAADGTLVAVQGGLGGTLGSVGTALGSGATTAAGAAAAGLAGGAGIVGGAIGAGAGIVDLVQGAKKNKAGDSKAAKTEFASGGSKLGMVGAGAGIGAAVGSVVPVVGTGIGAAVGAGVGGISALLGGDKLGSWISDATDEGGTLSNIGEGISTFFTETVPEKFGEFWNGVTDYFGSIPEWIGGVGDSVSTFFTETIPEKWDEFWEGVGDFFTETVPYAIGYLAGAVYSFFTDDLPEFFTELWDSLREFFTETLPEWAEGVWGSVVTFFTEDLPTFFQNLWDSIVEFFTETLPEWVDSVWNDHIVPFFTETLPTFISNLWDSITEFFTETLPEWADSIWNDHIVPFFTEDIPNFFSDLWDSVVEFVTETLPTWASDVFNNHIVPFFTDTIPGFFSDLWDSVKNSVVGAIAGWASSIASTVSGWWSDIKGWFSEAWGNVKSGFSAGSGGAGHAWGGIMETPHYGVVAEDGPEAIIPLSKGTRGLDIWKEAGALLGVDAYANGGIEGDTSNLEPITTSTADASNGDSTPVIEVQLSMSPVFQISGDNLDEESIVSVIKSHIREMTDDISDEMAERLTKTFSNMPLKGMA